MYVRLAFAVAAHLESEILIVDEVLAVGDIEFQKKCLGKMKDVSEKQGRTVLFVSHNLQSIASLASSALLMERGSSIFYPNSNLGIDTYMSSKTSHTIYFKNNIGKSLCFDKISIQNGDGIHQSSFNHEDKIQIEFRINLNFGNKNGDYTLFVEFLDRHKNTVFSSESSIIKSETQLLLIPGNTFTRGHYSIRAFIHRARHERLDLVEDELGFSIVDVGSHFAKHGEYNYGNIFVKTNWV